VNGSFPDFRGWKSIAFAKTSSRSIVSSTAHSDFLTREVFRPLVFRPELPFDESLAESGLCGCSCASGRNFRQPDFWTAKLSLFDEGAVDARWLATICGPRHVGLPSIGDPDTIAKPQGDALMLGAFPWPFPELAPSISAFCVNYSSIIPRFRPIVTA